MASKIRPRLVFADKNGRIFDHPGLLMLCRQGNELSLPRPSEMTPLPPESELFLLPGRRALGFDTETGEVEQLEDTAVAAFVQPGYTLTGTSAYETQDNAPQLPLFAYGAVGFANDRFWVCAKQVDKDKRQVFSNIPKKRIQDGAWKWLKKYPKNRLVGHLMSKCALTYSCPAAR
ncbi:MAG: radical SAM protein, partial [Thermodesulfobacteriota bacterium]|nr:radical SAM protein [Thermodesulfobacteriota bacterium]